MKLSKEKLESRVTYKIIPHPEYMSVRGNLIDSGDPEQDKEDEDAVIADIESGNEWAWCCVEVKCEYMCFSASSYLGGCSYKSEGDFINGGYYDDMKHEAFAELCEKLEASIKELEGVSE